MAMVLEAENLHFCFPGGIRGLDGLDLSLPQGKKTVILGSNGAGKTTLLLHLNGTLRPQQGRIRLHGQIQSHGRTALAEWRRQVGLVLQDPDDQLFAATVFEDVSFGPLNLGLSQSEAHQRVEAALQALHIADLADRPTHMLSFGQKKRVAIAGAIAMRPRILLLDEPTAGLDSHAITHLLAVLDHLAADGTTLVFTTHDVDLGWEWADRAAIFHQGRVLDQGQCETVLTRREVLRQARLKPPFLLDLAESSGWEHAPPPRSRQDFLDWLRENRNSGCGSTPSRQTVAPAHQQGG